MHWKIRRDPFFGPLAAKHGEEYALESGFFFDDAEADLTLSDTDWLSTPFPSMPTGERPVVLLSTGAFCPPHHGHIEMMVRARAAARRAGYTVLAGYLSPGHDAYVRMKWGERALSAPERLQKCADLIHECGQSDWMMIDPWESLHRPTSVNFTDVVARLRTYLRTHVHSSVDVLYVCGGDNARFVRAFTEDGGCIVVKRPGAEAEETRWRSIESPRILWSDADHPGASRAMGHLLAPERARKRVVVRLEDSSVGLPIGLPSLRSFHERLMDLLSRFVDVRSVPVGQWPMELPAISLDPMMPAHHAFAVSRLFALGGYQSFGHMPRPGAMSFEEQAEMIPEGDYFLCDDDSVTGGTFRAVRAMLPSRCRILGERVAFHRDADEDVLDARDFLLGSKEGGLVVSLGSRGAGRAVYALPYADPSVRSSIPFLRTHEFSASIWRLNADIFSPSGLRIGDLAEPSQRVVEHFGKDTLLTDLCTVHAERLTSLAPRTL